MYRPGTSNNRPLTRQTMLWQYQAMLGEPENQFSLTRAALSTWGTQKANSYQESLSCCIGDEPIAKYDESGVVLGLSAMNGGLNYD